MGEVDSTNVSKIDFSKDARFVLEDVHGLATVVRDPTGDYDEEVDFDGMSLQVWHGGRALTEHIMTQQISVAGRVVLEIGSGCGSASIACALQRASYVMSTEYHATAISLIQHNAILNESNINVFRLDWDEPAPVLQRDVEVIICADLVFLSSIADKLAGLVVSLAKNKKVEFHMIHETRRSISTSTSSEDATDEPFDRFVAALSPSASKVTVLPVAYTKADLVHLSVLF